MAKTDLFKTRSEWEQLVNEYKYGLKSMEITKLPYGLALTTFENENFTIIFHGNGFKLVESTDKAFDQKIFESMDGNFIN